MKENAKDEVPSPVENVEAFLEETVTVEPTTSAPVRDEMKTRDEVPSLDETDEECLKGTLTVETTTSAPVMDEMESTRDEVPIPV